MCGAANEGHVSNEERDDDDDEASTSALDNGQELIHRRDNNSGNGWAATNTVEIIEVNIARMAIVIRCFTILISLINRI